jgi:hypothetical protein
MPNNPAFDHRAQPSTITEEQQIEAPQKQLVLPKIFIGSLTPANATPSVKNAVKWKAVNTGAHNVTNFLSGQEGQEIQILGDGQTTIVHDVTKIICLTGANTLLASNKVYKFTLWKISTNYVWVQH